MSITYSRRATGGLIECGFATKSHLCLRDAGAWEFFNVTQLPSYIQRNLERFRRSLNEITDIDQIITSEQEKELYFMLDSLLQAKRLLQETQVKEAMKP